MPLPPAFEERSAAAQLAGGIVVPVVFGLLTGFALGWSEVLYLIMVGPIGIVGGFLGGIEHREPAEGFVRGLIGGLVYGSFILLGHEIAGTDAKAHLPDPHAVLAVVTSLAGGVLGALGARFRARREQAEPALG
jgi:hypothetical protein